MKWNRTKLITAGGLGALLAILSMSGGALTAIVGIPSFGGIINSFFVGVVFAFSCLLIRKFGAATLVGFVYGICTLPLPVTGPPGFLPKIIIAASAGLVSDSVYAVLKSHERLAAVGVGIGKVVFGFEIIGFGILFSVPGIYELAKLFLSPIAIIVLAIIGGIGGFVGYVIFDSLRNTASVRKIQGV